MKKFILASTLAATAFAVQAKDIVDTAVAAGSFKTLATALQAAGLVDTLKGKGPFTVFAPTDEAFAKLGKDTIDSLLKPENKAKLVAILKHHVVAGDVRAETAITLDQATTIGGDGELSDELLVGLDPKLPPAEAKRRLREIFARYNSMLTTERDPAKRQRYQDCIEAVARLRKKYG
jgi:hypothetical protein